MNDSFTGTIQALKFQAQERVETLKSHAAMGELLKLHNAINVLEDLAAIEHTSLSQLFGLEAAAPSSEQVVLVKPGQYFDKTPLEAAKDYLGRKKKAADLDEIIDALKTGSCDPGPRDKFGVSLARSTFSFVKIGDDLFDLLERYPNVQAQRKGNLGKRSKAAPSSVPEAEVKSASESA